MHKHWVGRLGGEGVQMLGGRPGGEGEVKFHARMDTDVGEMKHCIELVTENECGPESCAQCTNAGRKTHWQAGEVGDKVTTIVTICDSIFHPAFCTLGARFWTTPAPRHQPPNSSLTFSDIWFSISTSPPSLLPSVCTLDTRF